MFSNWRDCQPPSDCGWSGVLLLVWKPRNEHDRFVKAGEWDKQGLSMSTTSNEAAKLYDALLSQYIGWYDENSVGGMEACCTKLLDADPNCVLGNVLVHGLDVMGTGRSIYRDPEFKANMDNIVKLAETPSVTPREKLHVEGITAWAYGEIDKAQIKWEEILLKHPTDMLALKFAHDSYFYMGYSAQMRDSLARVLPYWKSDTPLYGYLKGMYAFGLVETNFYTQAEKEARMGLNLNKNDGWSTHSMAHVFEMMGRQDEGISFMGSTVQDWTKCGMLACHNFWHWAVYYIEKGEYTKALDIYDSEIGKRVHSGALLDIVDACSMLFRLQMEGVDVGDRWKCIYEICQPRIGDHILAFNDIHLLMSTLGNKQKKESEKLMESIKTFINNHTGTQRDIMQKIGITICEAVQAYSDGDFAKAVDIFLPVRYKVVNIGGSNAQRDLFNLFLINAALKSSKKEHHQLARSLLVERKALKESAPMTDRLMGKAIAQVE